MPLTLSATFANSSAAASAVRLLRLAGIGVGRVSRPAPNAADAPYPFDATGLYTGGTVSRPPHAHALVPFPTGPTRPAPCSLALSVEPGELSAAREIVYRCGGVLR